MNYLVMLDGDSPAGSLYVNWANGSGKVNGHYFLCLECRSVDFQIPGFIHVQHRLPRIEPVTYRAVTFPISALLFVTETEKRDDMTSFGFTTD